ncbi:hypothetical protein [Sphingomonas aerolata]|uniref:hypothetical protein n=1 Tax=Sphingomonas aerolata TaxID=185951 RepID=UPI002FDFE70E
MMDDQQTKDDDLGAARWRWNFVVSRLKDAYEAACYSLDKELRKLEKDHKNWQRSGPPDPSDPDEVESHANEGEWIGESFVETEHALQLVRQGFAVVLFHSWERHALDWARKWTGWKDDSDYNHHYVTNRLKRDGFIIDAGLHKLNKVANCIKHDDAELWKEDQSMFDPLMAYLIDNDIKPDYGRHLRLSEIVMQNLLKSLSESGPSQQPTLRI